MRRVQLLLILVLLLALVVWWRQGQTPSGTFPTEAASRPPQPTPPSVPKPDWRPSVQSDHAPEPALPVAVGAGKLSPTPNPRVSEDPVPLGPRFKRAYVLQLDAGKLTLMAQEDIEGDFATPPHPPETWSGMLRCRLLWADGSLAGEEIIPAPDHLCTVLDAHVGAAEPINYTVAGPSIFQLRLPRVAGAAQLSVARVVQPDTPASDTLLGIVPLPPL